jgi:hypothetical protein
MFFLLKKKKEKKKRKGRHKDDQTFVMEAGGKNTLFFRNPDSQEHQFFSFFN